jgi:hypothetical protein
MSVIRSSRFQPYVIEENAKGIPVRKRNPAFKELREYEATLRSASRHMAALRAEEAALLETAPEENPWSEFRQGNA